MAIFEVAEGGLRAVPETSFGAEGIHERKHLQRLLRENISVLDDRLFVVTEEFGNWVDSSRRIDLLCLDSDANLVVVELKRTEDGGHMDLQALRYAAMISEMTFDQLVEAHAHYRDHVQFDPDAARAAILDFLRWDEVLEDQFGLDTRIILAAADFGKEITTTVMWLNERDLDVRCIRLKPYRLENGPVLLDVQQIVPLPEAASFQTKIGTKRQAERDSRKERTSKREDWWRSLLSNPAATRHADRTPNPSPYLETRWGAPGIRLTYSITMNEHGVQLYIGRTPAENLAIFDALLTKRAEIDAAFGDKLDWDRMEGKNGCRVMFVAPGGYRSPEIEWPEIQSKQVDEMRRLETAFQPYVALMRVA